MSMTTIQQIMACETANKLNSNGIGAIVSACGDYLRTNFVSLEYKEDCFILRYESEDFTSKYEVKETFDIEVDPRDPRVDIAKIAEEVAIFIKEVEEALQEEPNFDYKPSTHHVSHKFKHVPVKIRDPEFKCPSCGIYRTSEFEECILCNKISCCTDECKGCRNEVCECCSNSCEDCGDLVCYNCSGNYMEECGDCRSNTCFDCMHECKECGNAFCSNCVDAKSEMCDPCMVKKEEEEDGD